jgi:RHS repeat-associated protein
MIKNVQRALLTLLALVVPLVTGTANAEVTYFHHDALGSVVAATNESGTLLWRESYQPFGERLDKAVSTDQHAFYYTGKPHDDRTGLTYFGARYYDPVIGRFMGIDSVGVVPENVHTFNRYAYAANNPYKYVDPDGRFFFLLVPLAEYTFAMLAADVVFASAFAVATENAVSGNTTRQYSESNSSATESSVFGNTTLQYNESNSSNNNSDTERVEGQREKRRKRRERESRAQNGQNQSGEGFRDHEAANKGPRGKKPKSSNDSRKRKDTTSPHSDGYNTPRGFY